MTVAMVFAVIALASVVAAPVFDLLRYEIPDSLSIIILAAAIGYGMVTPGFGWLSHFASGALVFVVGLLAFARGWMGGGDVKLLAAIGAWTGLAGLPMQWIATAIAGGVLALVMIVMRRGLALAGVDLTRAPRLFQRDAPLPYAVAIAAGTLWWAARAWPVS